MAPWFGRTELFGNGGLGALVVMAWVGRKGYLTDA